MPALALFTRDLRARDLPMLHAAAADGPIPCFVLDRAVLAHHAAPNRIAFLAESLVDLDGSLRARGAALHVEVADDWVDAVVRRTIDTGAGTVHVSDDHSAHAQRRLAALDDALAARGCRLVRHPGITVVAPGRVLPNGGDHFKVFTPYYRRWLEVDPGRPLAPPRALTPGVPHGHAPLDVATVRELAGLAPDDPAESPARAAGGETAALDAFARWTRTSLVHYADRHDDVAADDTARIAAALHFGCLSPREIVVRLRERVGAEPFVRQLCWRDFYLQLLAVRPDTAWADVKDRPFAWRTGPDADADLEAWATGRTGFPLVDAGMRQLRTEGFVHNRARMVVASFLTKDLAIDWRRGAAEFWRWLTDGDVAQNQLNWQWVAGTGTDSNPHRIFNPTRQSERFDPDGTYIRRHVPELRDVAAPEIHDPTPLTRAATGYPLAIVDHATAIAEYRTRLT